MKNTSKRVPLDWSKLLAFDQVKKDASRRPLIVPAKTMIGGKGGGGGPPPA